MAGSSPSLPDGSNPSAAIVQSASDVQCSRLLKTTPELAAFFQTIGADGLSKAVAQRAILGRWAEDVTLTSDVRDYAQQQLATLPDF